MFLYLYTMCILTSMITRKHTHYIHRTTLNFYFIYFSFFIFFCIVLFLTSSSSFTINSNIFLLNLQIIKQNLSIANHELSLPNEGKLKPWSIQAFLSHHSHTCHCLPRGFNGVCITHPSHLSLSRCKVFCAADFCVS